MKPATPMILKNGFEKWSFGLMVPGSGFCGGHDKTESPTTVTAAEKVPLRMDCNAFGSRGD
jgi:hypothetical protein